MQPDPFDIRDEAEISHAGAQRLRRGHLWVYAGDVVREPERAAPIVRVLDGAHNTLGYAFYSPPSQIRLRILSRDPSPPDADLFRARVQASIERRRRTGRLDPEGACRLIFGEADLLPSIVVDRYRDCLALQTMSHASEALKNVLVDILVDLAAPAGIVERNDVKARRLEGLGLHSGLLWGSVPDRVEIAEKGVRFLVDLLQGQKTGFFLDQAENRILSENYAFGRALDCFSNTGGFALHFARRCESVTAVDLSEDSIASGRWNAERNGCDNVEFAQGNVFDFLRGAERSGEHFDTVCLDPPAFAKNRAAVKSAKAGYKEINLRAMKLLRPEGILITSSCSYHVSEGDFYLLLQDAARDAHRYVQLLERRSQASDHPALVGMPETRYLKCFILRML